MRAKKVIYLLSATILGILLSFMAHAGIESLYLCVAERITWYNFFGKGTCALHPIITFCLLAVGMAGGYMLGRRWWRVVYIEKRPWRFKKQAF